MQPKNHEVSVRNQGFASLGDMIEQANAEKREAERKRKLAESGEQDAIDRVNEIWSR